MKPHIKYIYSLFVWMMFICPGVVLSQTGVLTHKPLHPFHLDAAKDNAVAPIPAQLANDVVVTQEGKLGVGLSNPATRVDLRSTDQKGIIGIGENVAQTAVDAKAGAIRYVVGNDPNTAATEIGYLEYSDGEKWIPLSYAAPPKALVNATKGTSQNIPNNTETYITGWTESVDVGGHFDGSVFTAPRNGFYLVTFNITLSSGIIANSSYIETIIESNQATNNIPVFRTINSYPAFQGLTTVSNYVGGNCNAIFQLNAGNTIRFKVKHTLGGTRNTLNNALFNNISISEL